MNDQTVRDRNILDEGIKHRERVVFQGVCGEITGVDFNAQTVRIEINVSAHAVKRAMTENKKEP